MIGRILGGRYEIMQAIDSGGMAYIYKALCKKTKAHVALKVLKEKFSGSTEYVTRFKKEAQAAFSLNHENIVRVRDIGCDDGIYYMVMDFIEGESLKTKIENKGIIEEKDAILYAIQLCAALGAAHKRGIIHRDIKPHNILLNQDDQIKLTDFGIAKSISVASQETDKQVIGSVYYVSPEQARGEDVDARTDIYSLGIVLYEMLTGQLPFSGGQTVSVALKHINEQITQPAKINPEISSAVNKIVLKATSKNKKDRYRTADALKEDLLLALADPDGSFIDMPSAQRETAVPVAQKRLNKTLKIGILAVLAVLLLAVVVLGIVLTLPDTNRQLEVPNVTGQHVEQASMLLGRMGFSVAIVYDSSETLSKDYVITQSPFSGAMADTNDTITLTVSTGPAERIMPDLFGYSLENALDIIGDMGLILGDVSYEYHEDLPDGSVVSQSPAPDTIVSKGDTVLLFVAQAASPEGVMMPQLSGQTVGQAVRTLSDMGFLTCFVYEEQSTQPPGTVISQSPEQGIQTILTRQIDLWISALGEKLYHGTINAMIEIPENGSLIKIVQEVMIDGMRVDIVVLEMQAPEAGTHELMREITSHVQGSLRLRVYVNNAEVHVSEVWFDE